MWKFYQKYRGCLIFSLKNYSPVFSFGKCFPGFPFNWSRTKEIKCRSCFFLFRFDWTEARITIHVLKILVLQQCYVKFTLDGCVTLSLLFCCCLFVFVFNPEHLKLSMHIFHTVLYTFPMVLTRRICLKNKSLVGDHFLYSHDLNVWFRDDIVRRN